MLSKCATLSACARELEDLHRLLDSEADRSAWIKRIKQQSEAWRREQILSSRIEPPRALSALDLTPVNGPSFEEYSKGARSLIVKFAQASCGPCLAELRDLEKRRAQLPNDVRVAVVSVDDHPNDTAAVLREHGYEGIVFDGRRLARENGVRDYPTTWFLDARHELVFEKSGRSRELVEEYNWRVEAMAKP